MNKRKLLSWTIAASVVFGLLASCTRLLPGPSERAATPTATRPFMILPTATGIPPTAPLPTQASPNVPTPTVPAPTPVPTQAPATTQPQPSQPPVQGLQPGAELDIPNRYRLKAGEFPFCIARRYDVDPYELLRYNGLWVDQIFYEGQVLRFPKNPDPFPEDRELREHPDEYRVRRGDTIYSIACRYGDLDPMDIAAANGLAEPYRVKAGRELQIP